MSSTTTTIPTFPTTEGDLPAFVFPADHDLPIAETVEVGQIVAFFSRGRYRAAKVVKVTAKRVTAIYTTQGARDDAEKIAQIDYTARAQANVEHARRNAERYRAWAALIESGKLAPSEGFVPIASLPAEAQALEAQESSRNASRTTIVWPAAKYIGWAEACEATVAAAPTTLAKAAEQDAMPFADRVREATYVTTKSVKRGEVFAVEAC